MNFTHVEFPCTVDLNTFKAYFDLNRVKLPKIHGRTLNTSGDNTGDVCEIPETWVKSLRHLVLDAIIANWSDYPIYKELPEQADRNYMLSQLDVTLPLKTLSAHINEDFFWQRSYQHRWKVSDAGIAKPWIKCYMQRHLQEFLENLETCDYELESVQTELDICAAYINHLEINYLQPSMGERNDHIPLDFILSNLPELRTLRLTYCTKTVGMNFYLGCNAMSQQDVVCLARGLSRCHELLNFCLHSTNMQPYELRFIARSLDKGCHLLTHLSLVHCAIGDAGLREFLASCNKESFATLKWLDLTNNKITAEGAFRLSRCFKGLSLESLVLRLNPIGSDGAAAIFAMLHYMPLHYLDLSACYMCEGITKLFMQLIVQNVTLLVLEVSNNDFGENFGTQLYKIIGFNKTLHRLDLRNTGIPLVTRNKLKEILHMNLVEKNNKRLKAAYNKLKDEIKTTIIIRRYKKLQLYKN